MNRNMDLVREMLIEISEGTFRIGKPPRTGVEYHLELLVHAKYVQGVTIDLAHDGRYFTNMNFPRLTWDGNEFLDTIRQTSVWEQVKSVAKEKGVGLTIESIAKIGASVIGALLTAKSA
jgi:Hypothetical protein (DUF2513)